MATGRPSCRLHGAGQFVLFIFKEMLTIKEGENIGKYVIKIL
jgi:hypothetical protein